MPTGAESSSRSDKLTADEIYLRIWEEQQESVTRRWNTISVFISVSFAIFGLSFQNQNISERLPQRIIAVAIYWFSYLLYHRYADWSGFLNSYLKELESAASTQINLQSRWAKHEKGSHKWSTVKSLLLYFGLLYTIAAILLWQLSI